jgi:hypothetical protein
MNSKIPAFFFVALAINLTAQDNKFSFFHKKEIDTSYIESYYDKLIGGIYAPQKYVNFSVMEVKSGETIEYTPNGRAAIGIEGSYKWLGLGLAYKFPIDEKSVQQRGKTSSIDFQYNINMRRWTVDGYLQIYSGFYFSNMEDYFDVWNDESDYPKANMVVGNMGILANYVVNYEKFSYKAAFNYNEKQKKSAGSMIIGLYALFNGMGTDSTFIPGFAAEKFQGIAGMKEMGTGNVGLMCGYAYTFVIKRHWFVSIGLIPGFGLYGISAVDRDDKPMEFDTKSAFILQSRVSILYQKNRFYAGFTGISGTQTSLGKSEYSFSFGHGNTNLSVGYRFDAPGRLEQLMQKKKKNTIPEK